MIKKSTLILILIALSLGSFVYFYEIKFAPQQEALQQQKKQIFNFQAQEIKSLTVTTAEYVLKLERSPENQSKTATSIWEMQILENPKGKTNSNPSKKPANDAIVEFLVNELVKGKSERNITINNPDEQKKEYGLDAPKATVDIQLNNQVNHQIILGKRDFSDNFIYAQADPKERGNSVLLVSLNFENAVQRNLSEWQNEDNKSKPADKPKKQ